MCVWINLNLRNSMWLEWCTMCENFDFAKIAATLLLSHASYKFLSKVDNNDEGC